MDGVVILGEHVGVESRPEPVANHFLTQERPHAHFSGLVHHIEEMILTGAPSWPVQRTLRTTGVLAAVFDSSYDHGRTVARGRRVSTPHLHTAYRAAGGLPLPARAPAGHGPGLRHPALTR